MRLKPDQLAKSLQGRLAPVYLISGDEPLQLGELADDIRFAAKQAGYTARQVLVAESGFDWRLFLAESSTLSIFADRKFIDLRLPSAKPGTEGSQALVEYCRRPPEDSILLISLGKLTGTAQKSRWFQALEKLGVFVQVWPLLGNDLLIWLQRRCRKKKITFESDALQALSRRTEGNLLAAAQEVDKLFMLYGTETTISLQQLEASVADHTRFDVFQLVDSLLCGDLVRGYKILNELKAEGAAPAMVLWALTRELRSLHAIDGELRQGAQQDRVLAKYQVWGSRKPVVLRAVRRIRVTDIERMLQSCGRIDRQIKGRLPGDAWESLLSLSNDLAIVGSS